MKITPMTNAKGEIDYGHAWRYFQMGFTDEYGNSIPIGNGKWEFLSNKERRVQFEPVDEKKDCIPAV